MKNEEIRNKFLNYFKGKGHKILHSASLIPSDPTVLLTLAGMLPFKPYFLGIEKSLYPSVSTIQKCVRMNDIENVGFTNRHHTFFEMLGNFSFGDYFKKDAIFFAWDVLTNVFNLDKKKLYIAVFEKDDESYEIWKSEMGIPVNKIFSLGEDNNFWAAGPTGPCGPCSEIYYDMGAEYGCRSKDCAPGCDCNRFLEIWNLVFIEFNRDHDGKMTPLPAKNIDTGMGLERIASILQNVHSNFDTDLFVPLIDELKSITNKKDDTVAIRVIADHVRAATYMISDGIVPSNEGRGYVLRRIIRRAVTYGRRIDLPKPFLFKLSRKVVEMGHRFYPELGNQSAITEKYLKSEEEQFIRTLEDGMGVLKKLTKSKSDKILSGAELFILYDTYGFPVELITEIVKEQGFSVDLNGFKIEMEKQKEKARTSSYANKSNYSKLDTLKYNPTEFVGYSTLRSNAKVIDFVDSNIVILDKTPFYPESGGQVSDKGHLDIGNFKFEIRNLHKNPYGVIFHIINGDGSNIKAGDDISAVVDEGQRIDTARHHTATHLLHKALKQVLGSHANQCGSLVSPEKLRFDFNHFEVIKPKDIEKIEEIVNETINKNLPVEYLEKTLDEAKELGATALFGEKYGHNVRIVKINDCSMELCGGTHVKNTGDIKFFKITGQSSVASGIRRIEAVCGHIAEKYCFALGGSLIEEAVKSHNIYEVNKILDNIAAKKLEELKQNKQIQKQKEKERINSAKNEYVQLADHFLTKPRSIVVKDITLIYSETDKDPEILADVLSEKLKSKYVMVLWNSKTLIIKTSGEINAATLVKSITSKAGGGGGGRASFAKAGGFSASAVTGLMSEIINFIESV